MKKNTLRRWTALALSLLLLTFSGCSSIGSVVSGITSPNGEFPVEVNGVTVGARPTKVVVLSPSLADVVLALGLETQLAAGSETCTQPSLRSLTKIDGRSAQSILAEGTPDLVLMDEGSEDLRAELENAGIPVLPIAPATDRGDFEQLYAKVCSALTGAQGADAGVDKAQEIFATLDNVNRVVPKDKITTACYLYDLESRAVTGDLFGDTIMSYAGVTNVFKSLSGGTYDFESLRLGNPTVIFCAPGLESEIKADSRFADFQAVRNNRVYELDRSLMEWQGRTVVSAALEISGSAFPELLEESSMEVSDPIEEIESQVSSEMESSALEEDNTPYPTLQTGDDSDEVLRLQTRLDALGYLDAEYDGYYGQVTAASVEAFQRVNGLEATGIADAETQRKLYARTAKTPGGETLETPSAAE